MMIPDPTSFTLKVASYPEKHPRAGRWFWEVVKRGKVHASSQTDFETKQECQEDFWYWQYRAELALRRFQQQPAPKE